MFVIAIISLIISSNAFQLLPKKRGVGIKMSAEIDVIQKYHDLLSREDSSSFVQDIVQNKIGKIFVSNDYKQIVGLDAGTSKYPNDITYQYHLTFVNPVEVPAIVGKAFDHDVLVKFADFAPKDVDHISSSIIQNFIGVLSNVLPWIVIAVVAQWIFSGFVGAGGINPRIGGVGITTISHNVSLNNWAGSPEVLEECREVISYLDSGLRAAYQATGAEMPRGILLEGPPGTGKTMLAKGIATQTKAKFISVSGSEFVELYVGMGAARVRELFRTARENKPCVVFIDEIDAVGKKRGISPTTSNDEREQTLNQILYEMDGFNDNEGLLVLAATNRRDILDKALIRPGRFDRVIQVPLPDFYSRGQILESYLGKKPTAKNIITSALAEITDGFSGADLKNLVNEAAIIAARQNRTRVEEKDLYDAFEKSVVGLIRSNSDVSLKTKLRVAIHESGHAIMALQFPEYFEVQKVSIQATYSGAGGYTIFSEKPEIKEGGLYTRDILRKRLAIMLGGKAAEQVFYGGEYMSVGSVQDLKQANQLAQKMVGSYGMGKSLEVFYNDDMRHFSETTKTTFDRESLSLVVDAYNDCKQILTERKGLLVDFAETLMRNTMLNSTAIQSQIKCAGQTH